MLFGRAKNSVAVDRDYNEQEIIRLISSLSCVSNCGFFVPGNSMLDAQKSLKVKIDTR